MKFKLKELIYLLDGKMTGYPDNGLRVVGCPADDSATGDLEITELLTDSRALRNPAETLFFALTTASNDGHKYIYDLYRKGVRAFVVSKLPGDIDLMPEASFLVVKDVLSALQECGRLMRNEETTYVAITGTRGKTTLKEWIFQLLEPLKRTFRSPRSWNSQIGVPLSLWEVKPDTEVAIIEAGVSRPREMGRLSDLIRPRTAIFTNIAPDADSEFSSEQEKAEEKSCLAWWAETLIYCADSQYLSKALSPFHAGRRVMSWTAGDAEAPLKIGPVRNCIMHWEMDYWSTHLEGDVKLPGEAPEDIENGANALAFMLTEGFDPQTIAKRFDELHPVGTRLNVTDGVNHCSIVADSYTSDLSSLRPALNFVNRHASPQQSKTLIISDPRHESGSLDTALIADEAKAAGITRIIAVGSEIMARRDAFPAGTLFFTSTDNLLATLSPSDFSDEIILIKGAPEFEFHRIVEMLEARTHETVLEVNLDAVVANYNYFRSHLPKTTGLIAMVKASGYGAGSYEIARTLQDAGASYLAVAVLDEGIELRTKGITMPIMVMNPKVVNYRQMFQHRLEPEIYSAEMLADVIREAEKNGITDYPIHIKLDTGMHRMGFIESELPALMDTLEGQNFVTAATIFSHLATADCPDMNDYTELQLERFARMTGYILTRSSHPIKRHILNSAGILRYPEHHYDFARLGIGLYGANTLPPEMEKPLAIVSTLRTLIIAIREYEAGETIGYGRRGQLTRKSRIATIPIGYADGMNRHFGRGAVSVIVNGKEAPTVGNICMDACMIDVTDIDCRVGDSVEIFGPQAPLQRLADLLDTIPYEILTSVSPRVKRVYYRE